MPQQDQPNQPQQPQYAPQPPPYYPQPQPVYVPTHTQIPVKRWPGKRMLIALGVALLAIIALAAWSILPGSGLVENTSVKVGGLSVTLPGLTWVRENNTNVSDTPGWRTDVWDSSNQDFLFSMSVRTGAFRSNVENISTLTRQVIDSNSGIAFNCSDTSPICVRHPVTWRGLDAMRLETEVRFADKLPNAYHTVAYVFSEGGLAYYVEASAINRIWSNGGAATVNKILDSVTSK